MKVLIGSWSWYPVGGDWTYVENIKRLYEKKGYEVVPFSTVNEKNVPNAYQEYFVKAYDYNKLNQNKSLLSGFKALKNSIVSIEAMNNIDKLLDDHEISLVHLHLIHHWITPAIIWKIKKRGIPIIWTLHEYKLLCPQGTFVSNDQVCEKCFGGKFYNCAVNKCKKQSFLASVLASADAYFYKWSGIYKTVDAYLCPSQFLLNKFAEFGFEREKLKLTNLCYDIDVIDSYLSERRDKTDNDNEKFILYVGRIEKIKGIKTLLEAVEGTDVKLKIAGTGLALDEMIEYANEKGLGNVEFIGFQSKKSVYDLTVKSICVVCPSEWYENYPFSVIESLLLSKPVIGSRIGGIPELVIDNETGFLHEPGDAIGLREQILKIWNDKDLEIKLGKGARKHAYSKVNFETHWEIIENVISGLKINQYFKEVES